MANFSGKGAPTSAKEPSSVVVERDGQDHWIVVETDGLCGGIFIDEASAMRFAREQTHGRPCAVRKTYMPEMIFRQASKQGGEKRW